MSVEAEIAAMKAALGVRTEAALAMRLGVSRSVFSNFRTRGRVSDPVKFRARMLSQLPEADCFDRILGELGALVDRHEHGRDAVKLRAGLAAIVARLDALETGHA